ncbi:MAG: protein kinase [Archangium sp.]|nr:protein kinase [Archangium sp.]
MCPDDNALSALAGGTLSPERAAELRAHVEGCDDCRVVLGALASSGVAPVSDLPTPGSKVGRYQVLSRLGAGAMGVVFLAFDPQLERRVALKFVDAVSPPNAVAPGGFVDEARSLARLSHPNVVQVHEVFTHGAFGVIAMEFVEGENLRQWLAAGRSLSEKQKVLRQAALGLSAAHASNIVHRDLKPENVLVGRDGRVRVSDFGLSRQSPSGPKPPGATALGGETSGGVVDPARTTTLLAGTPAYMAPELHQGARATTASDQFALCVTAIEALTGTRPTASSKPAIMPPGAGGWLRGLEADPAARWPTVGDLIRALDRPERVFSMSLRIAVVVLLGIAVFAGYRASRPPALPEGCRVVSTQIDALASPELAARLEKHLTEKQYSVAARQKTLTLLQGNAKEARQLLDQTCVVETEASRQQLQLLRLSCLQRVVGKNGALLEGILGNEGPGSQGLGAYHLLQSQPRAQCAADRLVRAQASTAAAAQDDALSAATNELDARFDRRDQATLRADLEPVIKKARDTQHFHELARLLRIRAALRFDDGDHEGERADLEEGLLICEANGFDAMLLEFTTARMSASKTAEEVKLWFELARNRAARLGQGEALEGDLLLANGLAYWNLGDVGTARTQLAVATGTWKQQLTDDDPMVASTEVLEGLALVELGRYAEADPLLTRGRSTLAARMGSASLHLVDSTHGLTALALWTEDLPRARAEFATLKELRAKTDGESDVAKQETALFGHWLATLAKEPTSALEVDDDQRLLLALIDAEDALARGAPRDALAALQREREEEAGPLGALALAMEAEALHRIGDAAKAKTLAERVLAIDQNHNHEMAKARAYFVLGRLDEAKAVAPFGSRLSMRLR